MIIEAIFDLFLIVIKTLFGILPNLPSFDTQLQTSLDNVFNIIFDNLSLLGIFVRISTIKLLVPMLIIVINFDKIYHFTMWIIKKIPVSTD